MAIEGEAGEGEAKVDSSCNSSISIIKAIVAG